MSDQEAVGAGRDPVALAIVVTPTDPATLKRGLIALVDAVVDIADGSIIDWDTVVVDSAKYLNPETGQVLVRLRMAAKYMEVGL